MSKTPEQLAEKVNDLFSLPQIVIRINELLEDPKSSNADLEELIMLDPSLTSKLLKIVNSAYFGFPGKIDRVARAISMIGHQELKNLVMAASITETFKGIPDELIDMDVFWFHSVTSGVLAKLLATKCARLDRERFFLSGLLHGIGRLILFVEYPEQSSEILSLKNRCHIEIANHEKKLFGFTHAEVGAALLKQWQLPESIWYLIEHKLDPLTAPGQIDESCILNAAIIIADHIEPCAKVDIDLNDINLQYDMPVFQHLKLDENKINPIIEDATWQAIDILGYIRPETFIIY